MDRHLRGGVRGAVLELLIGIVGTAAIGAWLVAAVTGIQIAMKMPAGQRLSGFYDLGWWRFAKIEAAAGPAVAPLSRRYRMAFAVFFGAVLCLILISAVGTGFPRADGTPLATGLLGPATPAALGSA